MTLRYALLLVEQNKRTSLRLLEKAMVANPHRYTAAEMVEIKAQIQDCETRIKDMQK